MFYIRIKDGIHMPYFACDYCHLPVEDDKAALCWPVDLGKDGRMTTAAPGNGLIAHKGECLEYFKRDWEREGDRFMWTELDEAITQLKNNHNGNNRVPTE